MQLVFCTLQRGGSSDKEGNCVMEHCPEMWPKLRITSPNSKCPICDTPLNIYNVAYRENYKKDSVGYYKEDSCDIRLDSMSRAWCVECTRKHDNISWGN